MIKETLYSYINQAAIFRTPSSLIIKSRTSFENIVFIVQYCTKIINFSTRTSVKLFRTKKKRSGINFHRQQFDML